MSRLFGERMDDAEHTRQLQAAGERATGGAPTPPKLRERFNTFGQSWNVADRRKGAPILAERPPTVATTDFLPKPPKQPRPTQAPEYDEYDWQIEDRRRQKELRERMERDRAEDRARTAAMYDTFRRVNEERAQSERESYERFSPNTERGRELRAYVKKTAAEYDLEAIVANDRARAARGMRPQ